MSTQPDPEEIADIDATPESVSAWELSLPPEVLAEINRMADKENLEMIHKFEMHAMDYEKAHPESAPSKE